MDVVVTREAARDLETLDALGLRPSDWGLVFGRRRGHRFFVERLFPAGGAGTRAPDQEILAGVAGLLPGRLLGVYAVRPFVPIRRAILGPWFYGKLVLEVRPSRRGPAVLPHTVEFDGRFFLAPLALGTLKGGAGE